MAQRSIPNRVVDNRRANFPIGTYLGHIGNVQETWNNEKTRQSVVVAFDNLSTIEGEQDVSKRLFFRRFAVIWDDAALVDVQDYEDEKVAFPLRSAAAELTQLAIALGAAERLQAETLVDLDAFLEDLRNGTYKGQPVTFEVTHSKPNKQGSVFENVVFTAAEGASAITASAEDEEEAEDEDADEEEFDEEEYEEADEDEDEEDDDEEDEEDEDEAEEEVPAPRRRSIGKPRPGKTPARRGVPARRRR